MHLLKEGTVLFAFYCERPLDLLSQCLLSVGRFFFLLDSKMAASGGEGEHEWTAAVRPLLSASYTAFETKELPQLIGSIINR